MNYVQTYMTMTVLLLRLVQFYTILFRTFCRYSFVIFKNDYEIAIYRSLKVRANSRRIECTRTEGVY